MDYIKIYSDFLKKFLKPKRKLKVVFDCSNGIAGLIIKELFKTNSLINYKLINHIPDGNFPAHGPNPSKKGAFKDLRSTILKNKADFGAIFDADGDRAFFIDNLGRFIDPDIITRLLIWQLKPQKTVIDVRAGWLVKKLTTNNLRFTTSKVGHLYIKKLMRKIGADFGAERSGHYYFKRDALYFDSGILTAIETINAVSRLPYSLADFNDLLPQYYRSGEINIKRQTNIKYQKLFKKIEKYLKSQNTKFKTLNTDYLDGLTMEFDNWWFNLRLSNNEQFLRLNIEADNKSVLDNALKNIYYLIRN